MSEETGISEEKIASMLQAAVTRATEARITEKPDRNALNQPWIGHVLTLVAFIAMGVTGWVDLNSRITTLEATNEAQKELIEKLERKSDKAVEKLEQVLVREIQEVKDSLKEVEKKLTK